VGVPSSLTWDVMRMAGNTLHLLVILLAFSNLISLNAAPISSKHPTVNNAYFSVRFHAYCLINQYFVLQLQGQEIYCIQ
jgi:hypothetical protein